MPPPPTVPGIYAAPVKDVARSLMFAADQGLRHLRRGLPLQALPDPVARLADGALTTVQRVGGTAAQRASSLAHALLDGDHAPPILSSPKGTEARARFAAAVHDGLRQSLRHLGAESCLVSEMAAASAWHRVDRQRQGTDSAAAARLYLALLTPPAVRDVVWPLGTVPPLGADRIATFAVLLAMIVDPAGFRVLVPATTDLSLALAEDLARARTPQAITALFDTFRHHV